jgi:hypothetical protein
MSEKRLNKAKAGLLVGAVKKKYGKCTKQTVELAVVSGADQLSEKIGEKIEEQVVLAENKVIGQVVLAEGRILEQATQTASQVVNQVVDQVLGQASGQASGQVSGQASGQIAHAVVKVGDTTQI